MARTPEQNNAIITGNIPRQLLLFFFPIWLGTMFQQLYNTVDTLIVGNFVGTQALAAVGATSSFVQLLVGLFCGPVQRRGGDYCPKLWCGGPR